MKTRNKVPKKTYQEYDSDDDDDEEVLVAKKAKKVKPIPNRFDLFDPPRKPEKDNFLKGVSRRITLLSLRVSYIENRLADYETKYESDAIDAQSFLRDPPYDPPKKLISNSKKFSTPSSYSPNSNSIFDSENQIEQPNT